MILPQTATILLICCLAEDREKISEENHLLDATLKRQRHCLDVGQALQSRAHPYSTNED